MYTVGIMRIRFGILLQLLGLVEGKKCQGQGQWRVLKIWSKSWLTIGECTKQRNCYIKVTSKWLNFNTNYIPAPFEVLHCITSWWLPQVKYILMVEYHIHLLFHKRATKIRYSVWQTKSRLFLLSCRLLLTLEAGYDYVILCSSSFIQ